jgi:hypothetical protein
MEIKEIAREIWVYITESYRIDVDLEDIEAILAQFIKE